MNTEQQQQSTFVKPATSMNEISYMHGTAREMPTPLIGTSKTMSASFPASVNTTHTKPEIGNSFSNNQQSNFIASDENEYSQNGIGFFLTGIKISPQRRALLDDINGKKWKTLSSVKKADLNDRSAPNFYIRENPMPTVSPAQRLLLNDINGKKWKKLSSVKKEDLRDRSSPMLTMRSFVMPETTPARRNLLADINGKKWKKLSAVSKDRLRDRSNPNLALWTIEKSPISEGYEKKYGKGDKNQYKSDFYREVPTTAEKAPVSSNIEATNYGLIGQRPTHLHSDFNGAFPVAEGHSLRHASDAPASWQGNTAGEKLSSLGKGFTSWIKEEASEIKDAFTHIGKRNFDQTGSQGNVYVAPNTINNTTGYVATNQYGVTNSAPVIAADLTAPGSSVTSGLKQQPVVDTRLVGNERNRNVLRTEDKIVQ